MNIDEAKALDMVQYLSNLGHKPARVSGNSYNTDIVNRAYNTIFTSGITLSISDIVFMYVLGMDTANREMLSIFNELEAKVIDLVNNGSVSEIHIKQNDGKIYQLHSVETMNVQDVHRSLKSFLTEGYMDIEFKTNNNKNVAVKKTIKHKI